MIRGRKQIVLSPRSKMSVPLRSEAPPGYLPSQSLCMVQALTGFLILGHRKLEGCGPGENNPGLLRHEFLPSLGDWPGLSPKPLPLLNYDFVGRIQKY